ncbi:hypothetical protein AHAS_Ahas11G0333700 [Arachis hypogaea]
MLLDEDEEQFGKDGLENVIKNYEKYARLNVSKKDDQEIDEENSAGRMLNDDEVIGDEIDYGIVMEQELSGKSNGEQ